VEPKAQGVRLDVGSVDGLDRLSRPPPEELPPRAQDLIAHDGVSRRGVVILPAKLRQALGIKADDQLIAETTSEGLLLRPAITLPSELYSTERIRELDEAEAELEKVPCRREKPRSARR
jgi:AbrB family looped-hinge helix DNA binding protein